MAGDISGELTKKSLVKDRGVVHKLGIDDKHEYLLNNLPFYRKITLAVIPPLQCPLGYLKGTDLPQEARLDSDDHSITDGVRKHKASSESAPIGDDSDVAVALGEENILNSFLGMLTTAVAYTNVDSLFGFKNLFHEKLGKPSDDISNGPKLTGYALDESGSDDELEGTEPIVSQQITPPTENHLADDIIKNSSDVERTPNRRSHRLMSESSVADMRTTDSTSSSQSPEDPIKTFAEMLEPETFFVAPQNERTVLQNSFMKNMNLMHLGDRDIIKYIGVQDEEEDEINREFLKYLTGEKLQDAFQLSDDDYYYARYSAWLIKDVLLQGHVHVTRDALCFYSILPTEAPDVEPNNPDLTLYSGALGHKLAHYGDSYFTSVYTHRFWGVLKPQSLCIYTSPTEQYFPVKVIDLNEAIYCEIENPSSLAPNVDLPPSLLHLSTSNSDTLLSQLSSDTSDMTEETLANEDVQSGVWFKIVCKEKTYRFHTGNIYSARHWYNGITKVIFELHNSNSNREVIFKIPMKEILDFKKNYILTGELDEDDYDNDTPVAFTFKYASRLKQAPSKLDKIKRKSNSSESQLAPNEYVNLLFFSGGVEFEKLMNLRVEVNLGSDLELSLNSRIRLKAKKMLDSDSKSVNSKSRSSIISTLQPDISPGRTLADKIAIANDQIMQIRNLERQSDEFTTDADVPIEKRKTMARLLSIIRPRFPVSDYLSPPVDIWGSMDSKLSDEKLNAIFENWEEVVSLQLPKPFSVQTLKNLKLHVVAKQRRCDEVARKLANSPILEDIKRKHQAKLRKRNRRKSSIISLDSEATLDIDAQSRELYPTDSSFSIVSGIRIKKSKLKSIKLSVQAVSTMGGIWSTDPQHYENIGLEDPYFVADEYERQNAVANYQKNFSLTQDTFLVASYYAYLRRSLPVYGKLYLGNDRLCFRSLFPGVSTQMIIPIKDIDSCLKSKSLTFGIKVITQGRDDLILEFATRKTRDDAFNMVWQKMEKFGIERPQSTLESVTNLSQDDDTALILEKSEKLKEDAIELAKKKIRAARLRLLEDKVGAASGIDFPIVLEDSPFEFKEVVPTISYNITLLTIGSRGDVQPYIALGKGLLAEGHNVTIATHLGFKDWILKHGLQFKEVAGNPAELMALMVTHGSMSVSFLREASAKFRGWITELLDSSWKACEGTDILIESPSAMGGIHIAEALGIPYMRAFTMPWTRTRAYPHAFIVPDGKRGGSYNLLTHVMFENIFWKGISSQVNRWRVETLGLSRTNLVKLQQSRIPFLYNISPSIFPPAVDFPDWIKVTGYWFLNEGSEDYEPPKALVEFIETARANNEKIVYIGFGSIVVKDVKKLTKAVVEAVVELGVKCILNKGWSDRLNRPTEEEEIKFPAQIYNSGNVPHDWLFNQIDAAVHHGGSGTTGATIRAGLPTIIKPFFGDQFFYASRVEELGAGIALKNLNAKSLAKAINSITTNPRYLRRAQAFALAMQNETGVLNAVAAIYSELAYSKSIITTIKQNTEQRKNADDKSGVQTPNDESSISFAAKGHDRDGADEVELREDELSSDDESYSSQEEDEYESGEEGGEPSVVEGTKSEVAGND